LRQGEPAGALPRLRPEEARDRIRGMDESPDERDGEEALASEDGARVVSGAAGVAPAAAADAHAASGLKATVVRDLRLGLKSGIHTFWTLARVMIPAYAAALVLERIGVIDVLAKAASPVMSLLGLPGEAAVPLVVGYVLNIYAAVGAMQAISLDARQITVLAVAILIGHNLLVEGAVLRRAGMNGFAFGALRMFAGLAAAVVANLLIGLI
jgi:hypothetical protein